MPNFWDQAGSLTFGNEADVEVRFVVPFLRALGYDEIDDIRAKYPVVFREGRRGRKPEADFVVFYGPLQNRDTSILVVEAKAPGEDFEDARSQAESYASNVRSPFLLITDGGKLEIWQLQESMESQKVFAVSVTNIASERGRLESILAKEAAWTYCQSLQHKMVGLAISDFRPYETAEVKRTNRNPGIVRRTLKSTKDRRSFSSSTTSARFLRWGNNSRCVGLREVDAGSRPAPASTRGSLGGAGPPAPIRVLASRPRGRGLIPAELCA